MFKLEIPKPAPLSVIQAGKLGTTIMIQPRKGVEA